MNHRISTILTSVLSILYAASILAIVHVLPEPDKLEVYFKDQSGIQIHNFYVVSQVARIVTALLVMKVVTSIPEVNRLNRYYLLPYIVWNSITTLINVVVVTYIVTKPLTSTIVWVAVMFSLGTVMIVIFTVLMVLHFRFLLRPLRTRGPSSVAFLESSSAANKNKDGLIRYT